MVDLVFDHLDIHEHVYLKVELFDISLFNKQKTATS